MIWVRDRVALREEAMGLDVGWCLWCRRCWKMKERNGWTGRHDGTFHVKMKALRTKVE
jgi:hypothetical protein